MPDGTTTALTTVFIVDDHPAVCEALAHRIGRQGDLTTAGDAASLAEALEKIPRVDPDVTVIDISLGDGSGIDLIKRLKAVGSRTKILVWSMFEAGMYAERAMRAGASGYITKQHATEQIITAIRAIRDGKTFLSEPLPAGAVERAAAAAPTATSPEDVLSDRELEVFRLIGEGVDMPEIGRRMQLSVKTVETYRARVKKKLNIPGRMELVRTAVEWSLTHR
jgi:DNA-binding NarL/FixJ family response regulator